MERPAQMSARIRQNDKGNLNEEGVQPPAIILEVMNHVCGLVRHFDRREEDKSAAWEIVSSEGAQSRVPSLSRDVIREIGMPRA